jgi:CTP:molybdopterin cytidylyltransferase MocA
MGEATLVVLAAGRSSRMRGRDKLLEEVDGQPLIRRMARRAAQAGPTRVVLGPDQADRRAALEGLELEVLDAPAGAGMAASIVTGVAGLNGPVLVLLADMPEITARDLHLMLSLHAQAPDIILRAASRAGAAGHPVVFPADLLPDLSCLTGDRGARDLLQREARRVHLLPLEDDRALVDLDTPEDWDRWRATQPG